MDYAAAWHRSQVAAGEKALALRQSGLPWKQVAHQLQLGDETHARRAVGLYLSADLEARMGRGEARP